MSKNGSERAIQRVRPSEMVAEPDSSGRVVESIVQRGDISALSPDEMREFYKDTCASLGLNPLTLPLLPLRLNGKLILYATKNATDQLAARHRMSREITFLDEVSLGGKKYIRATCRATLPDGRVEVANGTAPVGGDPGNDMLKAETKAKRRAALSLLGLGLLDESEVESIPSHHRAPGPRVGVRGGEIVVDAEGGDDGPVLPAGYIPPGGLLDVPQAILDDIESAIDRATGKLTLAQAAAIWKDHNALIGERGDDVRDELLSVCPTGTTKAMLNAACIVAMRGVPQAVAILLAELDEAATPDAAVSVWRKHRAAVLPLNENERKAAWDGVVLRTSAVGAMDVKQTRQWLKRAVAEKDAADALTPPDDPGPRGGGSPRPAAPANDAAVGSAADAAPAQGTQASAADEARFRDYLATKPHALAVFNGYAAHRHEYALPDARLRAIAAERVAALDPEYSDGGVTAALNRAVEKHAAREAERANAARKAAA
jgi:hypothetical protein